MKADAQFLERVKAGVAKFGVRASNEEKVPVAKKTAKKKSAPSRKRRRGEGNAVLKLEDDSADGDATDDMKHEQEEEEDGGDDNGEDDEEVKLEKWKQVTAKTHYFHFQLVSAADADSDVIYPFSDDKMEAMGVPDAKAKAATAKNNSLRSPEPSFSRDADDLLMSFHALRLPSGKKSYVVMYVFDDEYAALAQDEIGQDTLYDSTANMEITGLFYNYHEHVKMAHVCTVAQRLLEFLDFVFAEELARMNKMIASGMIDYASLWYLFGQCDQVFSFKFSEERIFGKHYACDYVAVPSRAFEMDVYVVLWDDGEFKRAVYQHSISAFKGTRQISLLDIVPVNPCAWSKFAKRPDIDKHLAYSDAVIQLSSSIQHCKLKGKQYVRVEKGISTFVRNERVMVDCDGLKKFGSPCFREFEVEEAVSVADLDKNQKLTVFPFVGVFNLTLFKTWGSAHVKDLTPVKYSDSAFDKLVLDPSKKTIFTRLVRQYYQSHPTERSGASADEKKAATDAHATVVMVPMQQSNQQAAAVRFDDFIQGKGDSLIFMLHGTPGTGKTMTAESACEFLQRPLMSILTGDLGLNPDTMESQLNMFSQLASRWQAVMLLDEVDIFLENRETSDICRNAMVGIFLKFLEYYQGILFLTTNRIRSMDPAVYSRLSLILSYPDLNLAQRETLWRSYCADWKIETADGSIERLASMAMNGREIRNALSVAARIFTMGSPGAPLTTKALLPIIVECTKLSDEFDKSSKPHSSMWM